VTLLAYRGENCLVERACTRIIKWADTANG